MKLEQHILKVLHEQLLTEQTDSGWQISIKSNANRKSSKINNIAKSAGAELGFLVQARSVLDRASTGARAVYDIRQDVIEILKDKPTVLGADHQFDTDKFMYVLFALDNRKKYFKKRGELIGLVIDRTDINDIINAAELETYGKNYETEMFDNIAVYFDKLSNIKILDDDEYHRLITQIQQLKRDIPKLSGLIDQAKLPDINSIKSSLKGIQIDDPVTDNKNIRPVQTSWGDLTKAQIYTVPETGEMRIIPIEGMVGLIEVGGTGKGLFNGSFKNGIPSVGEVWYSKTNAISQQAPFEYNFSDHSSSVTYMNGDFTGTLKIRDDGTPGWSVFLAQGERHYNLKYLDQESAVFDEVKRIVKPDNIKGVIRRGTFERSGNSLGSGLSDGVTELVYGDNVKLPIIKTVGGAESWTPEFQKMIDDAEAAEAKAKKEAGELANQKWLKQIQDHVFKYPFKNFHTKEMEFPDQIYLGKDENSIYFIWNDGNVHKLDKNDFETTYKNVSLDTPSTGEKYDRNFRYYEGGTIVDTSDTNLPDALKSKAKAIEKTVEKKKEKLNKPGSFPMSNNARLRKLGVGSRVYEKSGRVFFTMDKDNFAKVVGTLQNRVGAKWWPVSIFSMPKDKFIEMYANDVVQMPEFIKATTGYKNIENFKIPYGTSDRSIRRKLASIKLNKNEVNLYRHNKNVNYEGPKATMDDLGKQPRSKFEGLYFISQGTTKSWACIGFKSKGKEYGAPRTDTGSIRFYVQVSDITEIK
jgi:hypothetical protein